ncbi:hypothetical protein K432DRAFT_449575 [Lepidopterella palustris CBS 459.81]|uniref:Uncharacterized protein n=1 Tax=Lepidopterella palustris CBS 459.81 TaxID=1314670 RepID=A0A8E2DX04_9PEZI|nr:hypothetical protein K432DRAFT_449575 [Lepidopterella palustris CBS 459.81]
MYTVAYYDDWRSDWWIDLILTPRPAAKEAFDFYTKAIGPWRVPFVQEGIDSHAHIPQPPSM